MVEQNQQLKTPAHNMTASRDHEVWFLTQDSAETICRVESIRGQSRQIRLDKRPSVYSNQGRESDYCVLSKVPVSLTVVVCTDLHRSP
jgi:hypothetical protein